LLVQATKRGSMKILINAYNLRIGGGESVGIGIINALYILNTEHQYIILINKNKGYEKFSSKGNIVIKHMPNFYTNYLLGNLLSVVYLIYITIRINPQVIFSMGNYAIPVKKKQLLFLHWPYVVYPNSIAWKQQKGTYEYLKRKVRAWIIKKQLRFATAVTVQTPLMKKQFLTYFHHPTTIHVVESSVSEQVSDTPASNASLTNAIIELKAKNKGHHFLLCLSQYYTHKNLEILLPLAEEIKKQNAPFKILLNLDPSQHRKVKELLSQIKSNTLDQILINLGPIPQASLYNVYQQADAFILPTLLESFGIIYREAMISGIPIFTSDLDFAHEACKEAAFYFDPLDHHSIYKTITEAFQNNLQLKEKIALGKEQTKQFLSWNEITQQYIEILQKL